MNARRLGFSFLYFTPRVREAHLPWLAQLALHGYDGAELPVADLAGDVCRANAGVFFVGDGRQQ